MVAIDMVATTLRKKKAALPSLLSPQWSDHGQEKDVRTRVTRIQIGRLTKVYDKEFNQQAIRSSSTATQYGYTRAQEIHRIALRKVKWRDAVNLKDMTSQPRLLLLRLLLEHLKHTLFNFNFTKHFGVLNC